MKTFPDFLARSSVQQGVKGRKLGAEGTHFGVALKGKKGHQSCTFGYPYSKTQPIMTKWEHSAKDTFAIF